MFIHWPQYIQQGASNDLLISTMDILPTFIEAAGGTIPGNLNGKWRIDNVACKSDAPVHDHLVYIPQHEDF